MRHAPARARHGPPRFRTLGRLGASCARSWCRRRNKELKASVERAPGGGTRTRTRTPPTSNAEFPDSDSHSYYATPTRAQARTQYAPCPLPPWQSTTTDPATGHGGSMSHPPSPTPPFARSLARVPFPRSASKPFELALAVAPRRQALCVYVRVDELVVEHEGAD